MTGRDARDAVHFNVARKSFDAIVEWLQSTEAMDHSEVECELEARVRGVSNELYQGWFDTVAAAERRRARGLVLEPGTTARARGRQLESLHGRVRPVRVELRRPREKGHFPLDARLNLPATLYSHPLQKRVAAEGRARAWDGVVAHVDETTSAHVPKRQAQEIAQSGSHDFDTFYAQRPQNDVLGDNVLLLGSSDAKGIRVVPTALRAPTRERAEAERAAAVRGDPMAPKKLRCHDKRMAAVGAVWEQDRQPRSAADIVSEMQRTPASTVTRTKLPRPANKRVWATIETGVASSVGEMFDEFDRRDPGRCRTATVLVDGDHHQLTAIFDHARRCARSITLVIDLIHVLHYIWIVGLALRTKSRAGEWVAAQLKVLLTEGGTALIAATEQALVGKKLSKKANTAVHGALKYFRSNEELMDYPRFLAAGLPIATGVIEGACRHLIQDRLGITGARWNLPGAEAMLRLRALHSSGDWDAYWRFHCQQEALRNYGKDACAA